MPFLHPLFFSPFLVTHGFPNPFLLILEIVFGHLTKVKRSKRLESETELLDLLKEADTFSLLAVYLARLIRWLEARGALERDSYSFTGRQVHSIPQLALEFYSARVIVDWSVAKFQVAECPRPHRGQKSRQCTRCRVVVLCECRVDDLDTEKEEWICDRCSVSPAAAKMASFFIVALPVCFLKFHQSVCLTFK